MQESIQPLNQTANHSANRPTDQISQPKQSINQINQPKQPTNQSKLSINEPSNQAINQAKLFFCVSYTRYYTCTSYVLLPYSSIEIPGIQSRRLCMLITYGSSFHSTTVLLAMVLSQHSANRREPASTLIGSPE